mmetsp:Transcript_10347/g.13851  ORF Transcript_10347/g.13851 Transcript_10347/m.13851 type:complete len:182 (-) Transcript_10347:586-1131(-)
MDLRFCDISIFNTLFARIDGSVNKILYECFKLCSSNFRVHVLGSSGISSDERKRNVSLSKTIKLTLCLLSSLTKTLHCKLVTRQINAGFLFEVIEKALQKLLIEILSTKHSVSVGCLYLKNATGDFKDGNIERTTTKIENNNCFSVGLVHTIRKCSCSWLIDNTEHIKTSNLTSILCCLPL